MDGIWLLQQKYVLDMLEKFGMTGCKPIATPIDQNTKLRPDVGEVLVNVQEIGWEPYLCYSYKT